jgi:hypothetical protein
MAVQHGADPTLEYHTSTPINAPKLYIFGGGYIGFQTSNTKRVLGTYFIML